MTNFFSYFKFRICNCSLLTRTQILMLDFHATDEGQILRSTWFQKGMMWTCRASLAQVIVISVTRTDRQNLSFIYIDRSDRYIIRQIVEVSTAINGTNWTSYLCIPSVTQHCWAGVFVGWSHGQDRLWMNEYLPDNKKINLPKALFGYPAGKLAAT